MGNSVADPLNPAGNLVLSVRTEYCTINLSSGATAIAQDLLLGHVLRLPQPPHIALQAGGQRLVQRRSRGLHERPPSGNSPAKTLVPCQGYDSRRNQVLTVDPKGNSSITVFDGASRTIQTPCSSCGRPARARIRAFARHLPARRRRPRVLTTLILDGNDRQTQLIDDRGAITQFTYDTLDRLVTTTFHDGSTRTNVYDPADDVTSYSDEIGNAFANTFDALGRKTMVTISPAGRARPKRRAQTFGYDGLSRMKKPTTRDHRRQPGRRDAGLRFPQPVAGRRAFGGNSRFVTNNVFASYPSACLPSPTAALFRQLHLAATAARSYTTPCTAVTTSPFWVSSVPARGRGSACQRPDLHLDEQRPRQWRRAAAMPNPAWVALWRAQPTAWATTGGPPSPRLLAPGGVNQPPVRL